MWATDRSAEVQAEAAAVPTGPIALLTRWSCLPTPTDETVGRAPVVPALQQAFRRDDRLKNLLACRQTRARPVSDIEQGYISSTACILANVSQKLGRPLEWNHAKGEVVGDEEANRLLRRPYRAPWVHPEPAAFS